MTVEKSIKALEKHIGPVQKTDRLYWAKVGRWSIEFFPNGEDKPESEVATIKVRRDGDDDDMMSDYSGGMFCDTIMGAIRRAKKYHEEDQAKIETETKAKMEADVHNRRMESDPIYCYNFRLGTVEAQISCLSAKVQAHRERQKNNQHDWGFAGDMGHIEESLREIISFLR